MKERSQRRESLPYRALLILILGGMLALLLVAFSNPSPLSPRTMLLLLAGVLLVVAIAVEVVFRDVARLRERLRQSESKRKH